jgi:hypothetical protein
MAGYSGTPLTKKLGIKEGSLAAFVNAPPGFKRGLDLPAKVIVKTNATHPFDFVIVFAKSEKQLRQNFSHYAARLKPDGILWVAWPKKSSSVTTDLTFANVQAVGLNEGLVDVKICAVDEVWSGLKFVFRLKDRPKK